MLDKKALAVKQLFSKYDHPLLGDAHSRDLFRFLWQANKAQWDVVTEIQWIGLMQYLKCQVDNDAIMVSIDDFRRAIKTLGFSEELVIAMTKDYCGLFERG